MKEDKLVTPMVNIKILESERKKWAEEVKELEKELLIWRGGYENIVDRKLKEKEKYWLKQRDGWIKQGYHLYKKDLIKKFKKMSFRVSEFGQKAIWLEDIINLIGDDKDGN